MDAGDQAYRDFQRQVDKVCTLILFGCPEGQVEKAQRKLRREAEQLFPDRTQLYEIVYESRFRRLWNQFRE